MTSQGSPYARFRRALGTGNLNLVLAAAAELPRVGLDDALRICRLMVDAPDLFERASVRWLGRFCLEARDLTLVDVQTAAGALALMPTAPDHACRELVDVCAARGLRVDLGS